MLLSHRVTIVFCTVKYENITLYKIYRVLCNSVSLTEFKEIE